MDTKKNINTSNCWDKRFGTGDWEQNGGFSQTTMFAESQISYLNIDKNFNGILTDFGCGAGDAFPIYKKHFPFAQLKGVDFSEEGIRLCKDRYSSFAQFYCSDVDGVPISDIIISSNVMEHIDDDKIVLNSLLNKCKKLFVIVPYMEKPLSAEHIRIYNDSYYDELNPLNKKIFLSKGWSYYGASLIYHVYLKNVVRFFIGKPILYQRKQIIFEFNGKLNDAN